MTERMPKKILKILKEARNAATLKSACFDWPDSTMAAECRDGNFKGRPDKFIKERVRTYHETWIIHRLDSVIAWAEGKVEE